MEYCIPFIIDKNSNGVKSLADDYSMLEALRIISAEKNNGFFGLGSKENISSMALVYIPFYLMRYNDSRGSLVFYDDLFANRSLISLPLVLLENVDGLCEEINNLSALYDLIDQVNKIIKSFLSKITERHDTFYTVARKDLVDCLYFYRNSINKIEEPKFILADCKNSERYAEICKIYGVMEEENKKYSYLENNLEKLIEAVNQKKDELLEKTSYQRTITYRQHSEKIDPLEKKFNEEIHPRLLAELNEKKLPIEKELEELYRKYKEDIIPRLILERDIQLTPFENRINSIKTDFEWQIKKLESENVSDLSNISTEKKLYESKSYVSSGISYDAEINSYIIRISNHKRMIEEYEDWIDKLKKTDDDTSEKQYEYNKKIREMKNEIDKCKSKIRHLENEKRDKTKQMKNEYNMKLSSFDTKKNNIQREYNVRISNLRLAMEHQITTIEHERNSLISMWDGKIAKYENIYSNERSRLIYSRDQVQQEYERIVSEEKSKFEPFKQERKKDDIFYEKAIESLRDICEKFNNISSKHLGNINEEFENVTDFFGMPIDFIEDEEYSGIIKLLVPIYIAEIQNKNNNNNGRFVILPPLIYLNGKCNYGSKGIIDSIKEVAENALSESYVVREDQPILHQEIKNRLKLLIDDNNDIKDVILNYIRNNSILKKNPNNILKLRVALEKMKKEGKIQENEYKKTLKIILSI